MNKSSGSILIAVAHPSEEAAVQRASEAAACPCEIIVTGVGGAAVSWALQKRFALGGLHAGSLTGNPSENSLQGTMPGNFVPSVPRGSASPGASQGRTSPGASQGSPSPGAHLGIMTPLALPDLVIGAGIAGSYSETLSPGTVVTTRSDCFADMGLDDNGSFTSLFGAGLADPDIPPFTGGRIQCSGWGYDIAAGLLPAVAGATVNMASGSQPVIERIRKTWDPGIETMEGAWLAYTCTMAGIPWIAVRAISNIVEPRNLNHWDIPVALQNMEEKMVLLLRSLTLNKHH